MRILYFDISGTLVAEGANRAKPRLADGAFEVAVRDAGFERLVCVSSLVRTVRNLVREGRTDDSHEALFRLCRGAFADADRFRDTVILPEDARPRIACIDLEADWWYLDDLAGLYCENAGREDLYRRHRGERILEPAPHGDGAEILEWLTRIASSSHQSP